MQKLIGLTKGKKRVFIELDTKEKRLAFLKQAKEEGFTIGGKTPTSCHCDSVMILHPDYTINHVVGALTTIIFYLALQYYLLFYSIRRQYSLNIWYR